MVLRDSILKIILDLIFPKFCYGCSCIGTYLCENCIKNRIYVNWKQICHICEKECTKELVHKECSEQSYLDGLFFFTLYDGPIKKMIYDVKYRYHFAILNDIVKIMANYFSSKHLNNSVVFTSVPLHPKKERWRGFNQADILGRKIAKEQNIQYLKLINRVRYTKTQVGLGRGGRLTNLKEAFQISQPALNALNSSDPSENSVIIVDDVFTTGTTLNECAKILKEHGFQKVYGFCFAKSRL